MMADRSGLITILIYFAAAVLPAAVLLLYVYNKDRSEKEPAKLLVYLVIAGIVAGLASILLESAWEWAEAYIAAYADVDEQSLAVISAAGVAVIEEITKFWLMKGITWRSREFNYRFDAIVYAVFVSLGFAAFENILYIFFYAGIEAALMRALLSVPAHMTFAVYMGVFYGRAKVCDRRGYYGRAKMYLCLSYFAAVILHAIYDGALMIGTDEMLLFFFGFVAVLDILVMRRLKLDSGRDVYIG